MTEQPTSIERPQLGADPAEARGAFLCAPEQSARQPVEPALPAQARADTTPVGPGTATPRGKGKDGMGKEHPVGGPEHSQPAITEPDALRPRPAPDGIPAQPDRKSVV